MKQHDEPKERQMGDSHVLSRADFWVIWTLFEPFHCFFFRKNVKREQLDENDFHYCYVILFRKYHSESTNFFFKDHEAPSKRHLKDT